MEELKKKRWSVTYTKHIKQKRKVYHDGFLDLHISTNKAMLFGDCEKLLECRILKDEEVVSPGKTLIFNAFVVDVGDPEGNHDKPVSDLNLRGKDRTIAEKPSLLHRKKFRSPSISSEDRMDNVEEKNNAWKNNLSPSQKIIREFKKSELQRYGTLQSSPDNTLKPNIKEWQVLYTTHITQKAKKFHDGFLRLSICGSIGRQVMLYDETRKLLTSRCLKTDEILRLGESISLDGYLVEIGEPEGDLNIQRNHCNIVRETKKIYGQQNCFGSDISIGKEFEKSEVHKCEALLISGDTTKPNITEWQVIYTTQMTQKAKKYHDGFLRLASCGSLGRQIMLYDISKKLLDSRFLKKDEIIRSGESIAFHAHLVDIGEPEGGNQLLVNLNVQGSNFSHAGKAGILNGHQNCLKANKSVAEEWHALYTNQITQKAKKYHSGILRLVSCGSYNMQVTLLNEDKTTLSSKFLSLSEDVRRGSMLHLPKYLVEVGEPCTSSEGKPQNSACSRKDADSTVSISSIDEIKLLKKDTINKPSNDVAGKLQNNACLKDQGDSGSISCADRTKLSNCVPTNKPLRDACQILSILQKPIGQESVGAGCTDKSAIVPVSSTRGLQVSDADVDHPADCQLPRASLPNCGPSENLDIGVSSEVMDIGKFADLKSSKAISGFGGNDLSNDAEAGISDQTHLDNVEAHGCDEALSSGISTSACAYAPYDNKLKSLEQLKSAREMDDWPSFDLEF